MAEHSPIYSAKTGQQIGHVKGDQAFDLFGRPCAIYNMDTGVLHDPNSETPVGYVSLTNIFVGSSWIAEKLFPKTEAVLPPQGTPEIDDQAADAPTRRVEHGDREGIDAPPPIAQTRRWQQTDETGPAVTLSDVSDPVSPERARVQELGSQAASVTPVTVPSQLDDVVGAALSTPSDFPQGGFLSEQHAHGASVADEVFAPSKAEFDHAGGAISRITAAPAPQPDDAFLPIRAPSHYDRALESAQLDVHASGAGAVPPAVEAFMRSLAAYVSSSTAQTATPSSSTEGAAGRRLNANSAAQKDVDQVLLPGERYAGEPDLVAAADDLALPAAEEEAAKDEPPAEEQTAAEDESSDSITATPPPITFVAGEAWLRPISSSRDHTGFESVLRDWRLDDAVDVGRESFAQSEFTSQADSNIDEPPGPAFSARDQAAQPNVCEPYDWTDQDDAGRKYFDGLPPAADEAPVSNESQGEASGPDLAPDLAKVFFEVDMERAVAVARSELWSRDTGRAGADCDPTEDFFSVDIERAVRLVRDELGEAVHTTDHLGAVGDADATDPTREIFSTDMDRILKAVLRELEKKPQ